jgi:hypothetical protein
MNVGRAASGPGKQPEQDKVVLIDKWGHLMIEVHPENKYGKVYIATGNYTELINKWVCLPEGMCWKTAGEMLGTMDITKIGPGELTVPLSLEQGGRH